MNALEQLPKFVGFWVSSTSCCETFVVLRIFILPQPECRDWPGKIRTLLQTHTQIDINFYFPISLSPFLRNRKHRRGQISSFRDSKVPRPINKASHRWYVITNGNIVTIDWRHYSFHTSTDARSRIRLRLELCSSFLVLVDSADDNRWVLLFLSSRYFVCQSIYEAEIFLFDWG